MAQTGRLYHRNATTGISENFTDYDMNKTEPHPLTSAPEGQPQLIISHQTYGDLQYNDLIAARGDQIFYMTMHPHSLHQTNALTLNHGGDTIVGELALLGDEPGYPRAIGVTTQGYLVQAHDGQCVATDNCSLGWDWTTDALLISGASFSAGPSAIWAQNPSTAPDNDKGPGLIRTYLGATNGTLYRYDSTPFKYDSSWSLCTAQDSCDPAITPTLGQSMQLGGHINATPTLDSLENIYVALSVDDPADTGAVCKLRYPTQSPATEDFELSWCQPLDNPPAGGVVVFAGAAFIATTSGKIYAFEIESGAGLEPSGLNWARSGGNSAGNACVDTAIGDYYGWPKFSIDSPCDTNTMCSHTCIANICENYSAENGDCDANDDDDCLGALICVGEFCQEA